MDFGLKINKPQRRRIRTRRKNCRKNNPIMNNPLRTGPTLSRSLSIPAKRKSSLPNSKRPYHSYANLKEMNWKQAKQRFPGLAPQGDADFDGTRNKFDCKVFDPTRDGGFSRFIGMVTRGKKGQSEKEYEIEKAEILQRKTQKLESKIKKRDKKIKLKQLKQKRKEDIKKLKKRAGGIHAVPSFVKERIKKYGGAAETIRKKSYSGFKKQYEESRPAARRVARQIAKTPTTKGTAPGKSYAGPGRPTETYKLRVNPFTGKLVSMPAVQFYKLREKFKAQQELQAQVTSERVDRAQVQELARRGIPPEQAEEIVDRRQEESVGYVEEDQPVQQVIESPDEEYEEEAQPDVNDRMAQLREMKKQKQLAQYQQPQRVYQQPQQVYGAPQQPQQRYKVRTDIMTGRKTSIPLPPQEKWARGGR